MRLTFNRIKIASLLENNVLLLVCLLPLLIPFGIAQNIGLQGILVMLTGILAWLAVACRYRRTKPDIVIVLLGIYILFCLLSLVVNPSVRNFFGAPLIRLGSIQLIACVGIGLALRQIAVEKLKLWLYLSIVALALISLPYALLHTGYTGRLGGVFFQADILAAAVAVGLLIGNDVWRRYRNHRLLISGAQIYLATVILLTQTRAVIALTFLLLLTYTLLTVRSKKYKISLSLGILATLVAGAILLMVSGGNRLTDTDHAIGSIKYRIDLQEHAAKHLLDKPLFGYGAGSVAQPLSCSSIVTESIAETCSDGYYFNSSHNIFLDRFLALGWLGGASFCLAVVALIWRGLTVKGSHQVLTLCALLITLYYLTNVTLIMTELLLFICLLQSPLKIKQHFS